MVSPDEYKLIVKLVKSLKSKFYNKTGKVLRIEVTEIDNTGLVDLNIYSIDRIRNIVNKHIPEFLTKKYGITCISQKARYRPLTDLRKIYCKVGKDMGFTYSELARTGFNGADHTDARFARRKAEDYLAAGIETKFIALFNIIQKQVNDDYRNLFNLLEEQNQSKPIVSDDMLQG